MSSVSATDRHEPIRVVMAGGGTGGHLFPGLAVAREISDGGGKVMFVGTEAGLESKRVPQAGYPLRLINIQPLKRVDWKTRLRSLAAMPKALFESARILHGFKPHVALGLGGYASGPMMVAAWMLDIPVVLMEQNTVPGITNRMLSRIARKVVIAFTHSTRYFPQGRTVLLGNPVRKELVAALAGNKAFDPDKKPKVVTVLGGSQGAHALNELFMEAAWNLAALKLEIIHQTGPKDTEQVEEVYRKVGIKAQVQPFFSDMAQVYQRTDLAVCRAGATTLAELMVAGIPALLVPYPYASDDHQTLNAQAVSLAGGGMVFDQAYLTSTKLSEAVSEIFSQPGRATRMSEAMRSLARPDAAKDAASLLLRIAGRQGM